MKKTLSKLKLRLSYREWEYIRDIAEAATTHDPKSALAQRDWEGFAAIYNKTAARVSAMYDKKGKEYTLPFTRTEGYYLILLLGKHSTNNYATALTETCKIAFAEEFTKFLRI